MRYFNAEVPIVAMGTKEWQNRVSSALVDVEDDRVDPRAQFNTPLSGWKKVLDCRGRLICGGFLLGQTIKCDLLYVSSEKERDLVVWMHKVDREHAAWCSALQEIEVEVL